MSESMQPGLGAVISLWRYPVKSMLGEYLHAARFGDYGVFGDRAYALLDASGKVATAKNPRKWPTLFSFRATFVEQTNGSFPAPSVQITLPDGTMVTSEQPDVNEKLSRSLNREVTLEATDYGRADAAKSSLPADWVARSEAYWPDMDGFDHRDTVTDFELPTGTFFDCATIHLLTTATLNRLRDYYPQGQFQVRRFRPNIVVEPVGAEEGFTENAWIGHTLAIGDEVRLSVTGPCGRCVMTTLPQGDLPRDNEILRTIVRQNHAKVGVYATVVRGGTIRRGDQVQFDD